MSKFLTYEAYLQLPETTRRYEIIDGELMMPPAPTLEHQWNVTRIYRPIDDHVTIHRLGVVFVAPLDVMIRRSPLQTRQPDVLFISIERIRQYGLDTIQGVHVVEVPPDLVVEVISPSESKTWIADKLADYQHIGVRECWLVRATQKTVEVIQIASNSVQSVGVFKNSDLIASNCLPDLPLSADQIFAPPDFLKW